MYELAESIQRDRRKEACLRRMALSVPQHPLTLSVGRYRITVARDRRALHRAV